MPEEYRLAFVISVVDRELGVGYFVLPPVHPKGGLSKCSRILIPPTQPNLFPLIAILVEKMNARR